MKSEDLLRAVRLLDEAKAIYFDENVAPIVGDNKLDEARELLLQMAATPTIELPSHELRLRVGALLQQRWNGLTEEQLDALKALVERHTSPVDEKGPVKP